MTDHFGAHLEGDGGLAQGDGAMAAGAGSILIRGDHNVIVQGENVRDKELAYLDGLLTQYEYWQDHYTPLAGIAEVREAVREGPRLDLPMPFVPREFERLVEHGYGPRTEVRREPVADLRTAVREHRRVILLGDPGSGKTTTLWQLTYAYAEAAKADPRAPLPVLVRLGDYTTEMPFADYLSRHLGPLAPYAETYRASRRLILLLDGLNEMPQAGYAERVARIQEALDQYAGGTVVVTCRPLDYVVKLKRLQKIEVAPLDEDRIQTFLYQYLGKSAGARLLERMRTNHPSLLAMGRNPYLLLMTAQVYVGAGARLPTNRAQMFRAFVNTLLDRERERHPERWIAAERQKDALAALAYAMQAERGRGTTVARDWAEARLDRAISEGDPGAVLYLATSASLLDGDEASVRFYHQLLQEYFAAREMRRRVADGEAFAQYWPHDRWWEPSGWEETAILMLGMAANADALAERLATANPIVAARCLTEGDPDVGHEARDGVVDALIGAMRDESVPPEARARAGRLLAELGDPRPGVGVREDGLPDIEWCEVPAGPFLMGSSEDDAEAYDDEKPQHELSLPTYYVSRYPVTVAQFRVFVEETGYEVDERSLRDPDNYPVRYVSWHDANAYCQWLTQHILDGSSVSEPLRRLLQDEGCRVRLPSEAEWGKAARGTDGRRYPWGADPDPNRANYSDTGIGDTSAVGCFPGGVSPYGVEELSGNVWEWTRSLWGEDWGEPTFTYPYISADGREDINAGDEVLRVLRGGAFDDSPSGVRCACRDGFSPDVRDYDLGFRVVVSPFL
jgi:formylglycine-generating enzyme required for sulfatase activity/energy-coupling factor transporter ATP-binding protein EcfA2